MLLDAALTEDVPAGIERGRPARHALADRADLEVADATLHPLLVKTLIEAHGIDLYAGEALREAWRRWAPRCACAAACGLRIRCCCTLRLGLCYLQSGMTARGRLRH